VKIRFVTDILRYSYGIRYNYGKEGKKKNWQPKDCLRIIMESVGPGETHGW
jgi:DNA primase large subunit